MNAALTQRFVPLPRPLARMWVLAAAIGFLTGLQREPIYWLVNVPFMLYIAAHLIRRQPNSTGSKHDDSPVNIALSFITVAIIVLFWFAIGAILHRALT